MTSPARSCSTAARGSTRHRPAPALACADQLVLVTDGEPETASLVCEAADWLQHSGLPVLVVNKHERSSRLYVGALERKVPFAHGIVAVPHDRRGAERLLASRFSWLHAPTAWRAPLRELAALIVTDWARHGQTP